MLLKSARGGLPIGGIRGKSGSDMAFTVGFGTGGIPVQMIGSGVEDDAASPYLLQVLNNDTMA